MPAAACDARSPASLRRENAAEPHGREPRGVLQNGPGAGVISLPFPILRVGVSLGVDIKLEHGGTGIQPRELRS